MVVFCSSYRFVSCFLFFALTYCARAKETVENCWSAFPELLARVDDELRPWAGKGISRPMLDIIWKCDDPERDFSRRLWGISVSVRSGTILVDKSVPKLADAFLGRAEDSEDFLQDVSEMFDLPDCDFTMMLADHTHDGFQKTFNETWNPAQGPLLVAYRLQKGTGTVAVPDWTFQRSESVA
jgi:hypothetical protein